MYIPTYKCMSLISNHSTVKFIVFIITFIASIFYIYISYTLDREFCTFCVRRCIYIYIIMSHSTYNTTFSSISTIASHLVETLTPQTATLDTRCSTMRTRALPLPLLIFQHTLHNQIYDYTLSISWYI